MRPVLRPSPSRVGWWARRLPLLRLLRLLLPRLLLPRLLPLLLLAHPGPAAAWGPGGHQAVGAIADQLIQGTAAAAQVRQLLGSSLQTASVWADCARAVQSNQGAWHYLIDPRRPRDECAHDEQRPGGQAALIDYVRRNASRCEGAHPPHSQCRHKAYHFTDLPIQHPAYAPGRPGTAPGDVVQTLNATLAVLSGAQAPAPHNIAGRAEALRLLVHFVGDLHQPLHVGAVYLSETGALLDPATPQALRDHGTGGGQAIRLQGRRLHESWDAVPAALYNQALAGGLQAAATQVAVTPGPMADWPSAWATESATVAGLAFKDLRFGAKVQDGADSGWPAQAAEPAYGQLRQTLQRQQIVKAGARLAQILHKLWP
jgi:hypothetical protein